jgi:hypothetical protein
MARTASKEYLPRELSRKISPAFSLAMGAAGRFMQGFGIVLAATGLHGTLVLHRGEAPHHNALMFFIGAWVFPALAAVGFTFSPFRPYRGVPYMEKRTDVDVDDPVVMRFVELFRSSEGMRHLWSRSFLKISGILFGVMGLWALVDPETLSWGLSPVDLGGAGFAIGGSFIAIGFDHIRWGLTTWAEREVGGATMPFRDDRTDQAPPLSR